METKKICPICKKEFVSKRKRHICCSRPCRDKYLWEQDIEKDLDLCKKLINGFLNNKLPKYSHSSSYALENYEILTKNNVN